MKSASSNALWVERDLKVLWHPCSQMKDHETIPLLPIRYGKGVWLYDFDGNQYLDAISSWWVNLFGHNNPIINEAIATQLEQLEHVMFAGVTHEPAICLAEALLDVVPKGLKKVFFSDNGSSAVEISLKMSFHYWLNQGKNQKTKFVSLANSYHGETIGALSVGQVGLYKNTYKPFLFEAIEVPSPDCYYREKGESYQSFSMQQFEHLKAVLIDQADSICAVIVEPLIQCAGGMRMYSPCYLSQLRQLCDSVNVHLIADEIAVGFGRTGTLFACEQANITPDFLCIGKGLTGGYLPLSAVLTTEDVYQAFYNDYTLSKSFLHSHSYTANPLAVTAACATLKIFKTQPVLENIKRLSEYLANSLMPLQEHPRVAEVRQTGLVAAIELVKNKADKTPYPWQERRGLRVMTSAIKQGVLLRPLGSVVYFMPPFVISEDEITQMVDAAVNGIEEATRIP